jgi:L-threonylcarbamoyladenylate synthase
MKTILINVDSEKPEDGELEEAVRIIRNGGLVAFPTETVYGLGASAVDGLACEKIFIAKKRPPEKALILHMHKNIDASEFVFLNDKYILLRQYFGDGPLTYVLEKKFQ